MIFIFDEMPWIEIAVLKSQCDKIYPENVTHLHVGKLFAY